MGSQMLNENECVRRKSKMCHLKIEYIFIVIGKEMCISAEWMSVVLTGCLITTSHHTTVTILSLKLINCMVLFSIFDIAVRRSEGVEKKCMLPFHMGGKWGPHLDLWMENISKKWKDEVSAHKCFVVRIIFGLCHICIHTCSCGNCVVFVNKLFITHFCRLPVVVRKTSTFA